MVYRVIEELKLVDTSIVVADEADAINKLVKDDGSSTEDRIATLDASADNDWTSRRTSLVNTINNVTFSWDPDSQILTRTMDFEDQDHYIAFGYLRAEYFIQSPEYARTMTVSFKGNV